MSAHDQRPSLVQQTGNPALNHFPPVEPRREKVEFCNDAFSGILGPTKLALTHCFYEDPPALAQGAADLIRHDGKYSVISDTSRYA